MHNLTELPDRGKIYTDDVVKDKFYLELFCQYYRVELIDVLDNNDPQLRGLFADCGVGIPIYFFSDDLGGYLVEGIAHCLGYHLQDRKKRL